MHKIVHRSIVVCTGEAPPDVVHRWFQSYLSDRRQYIRRGSSRSSIIHLVCGVPQGSVLGPILFVLYTVDLISLIESHGLSPHLYADDTQVYGSCPPAAVDALSVKISDCINDVANWTKSNRLQLNPDKTEAMWCTTSRRRHQLPSTAISIVGVPVIPAQCVRNLCIYIEAELIMRIHVQ